MSEKTGRSAIIEQFLADGLDHMFGNPGTVEQGFLDTLADYPRMKYILTLQESIAVLMGDGYARATKRPALVQIHSTPGLGNAIGAIYQAWRGHAPLVVIGGDAGIKYQPMDAQMAGDLVAFARPVTKWATMAQDPRSLLRVVRRAIKIAATPPMGPVYVCLPADVLDEPCPEEIFPTSIPSTRVVPEAEAVNCAAAWLSSAEKPMIFIGNGVAYSGAQEEVAWVAELIGAEVWEVDAGELNLSYAHPLYQGQTGHMFGMGSRPITTKGDVNLVVGTYMVPEVFPDLGGIFAPSSKCIHVDLDAYEIAKNHPVDLGLISDPKLTLAAIALSIERTMSSAQRQTARDRGAQIGSDKKERISGQKAEDQKRSANAPLRASTFMEALAKALPKDAVVFDEALTSSPELTRYIVPTVVNRFFQTRGGSLGVGIPGALAAKLAYPSSTVVGFTGDGGSMYTIQALWTAAHHRIGAKFVICNNRSYKLLELNILQYWKELGITGRDFPRPFVLDDPNIDFAAISASMGVPAVRVEKAAEVGPAIERMLADDGPFLVDLVIAPVSPG